MAVLLQDDFQRPDGPVGSPIVGGPYTVTAGTWAIQGGALRTSASSAAAYMMFPAVRDVDLAWVDRSMNGLSGMVFRFLDVSNNWLMYQPAASGGPWTLARRVAGISTILWTGPTAIASTPVRVICSGEWIYIFIDGKLQGVVQDQFLPTTPTDAQAGFYINSDTTQHFDDVLVQNSNTAVVPGGYDGGQASVLTEDRIAATRTTEMFVYKGRDTAADDTPEVA